MTKILIIKTSSMGDILHTFPALTDAAKHWPRASFDWAVEPSFAQIPTWHPAVNKVILVPLRQFRKTPLQLIRRGEVRNFFSQLRACRYDFIIDAQGLLKSALVTCFAKGFRCGLDYHSAWESWACMAYQKKVFVDPAQHAIVRMRQLFSQVLAYSLQGSSLEYNVNIPCLENFQVRKKPYLVFIHGTTWQTKEWPESYWIELASIATRQDFTVLLPWGNAVEWERAKRIAHNLDGVAVLPPLTLTELAHVLLQAAGAVSVDTGLGHLAAALGVPNVSLYGPTSHEEVGTIGANQKQLAVNFKCAPCLLRRCNYSGISSVQPACFSTLGPALVWNELIRVIKN